MNTKNKIIFHKNSFAKRSFLGVFLNLTIFLILIVSCYKF